MENSYKCTKNKLLKNKFYRNINCLHIKQRFDFISNNKNKNYNNKKEVYVQKVLLRKIKKGKWFMKMMFYIDWLYILNCNDDFIYIFNEYFL